MSETFSIEPLRPDHFHRLHDVFDAVCRERRFLVFSEAGTREETSAYYQRIVSAGHAHVVAVRGDRVLGWCDVVPPPGASVSQSPVLGMGIVADARGEGIGKALIRAAMSRAVERGITRIVLSVREDNHVAQSLYRQVGFVHERTKASRWSIDGLTVDAHQMAWEAAQPA